MREIIVRTISGVLYISIIIFSMFTSREWFMGLFLVLGIITLSEFLKLIHLKSYVSYILLVTFLYFFSYNIFNPNIVLPLLLATCIVNLFLLKDLFLINKIPVFEKKKYIPIILYIIGGFVFITLIPMQNEQFQSKIIIGVFILIWAYDTFAYLVGMKFGKRKLFERISPKKTMEGFLGGTLAALLVSFVIFKYIGLYSLGVWVSLALIIAILGTLGDLIQSKFKRQAGVKDSGILMPGHGGLFDRFDSILFASPFIYGFLLLINYVS